MKPNGAVDRHAPLFAALSARAYRVTRQRRDIITEFARASRYISAQELHDRLKAHKRNAGLATVYRTLEMLCEIGAASSQPHAKGETAYLFCPISHHHHAVCTKCGQVADVPCTSITLFTRALSTTLRFQLSRHRLEFYGTCSRCS